MARASFIRERHLRHRNFLGGQLAVMLASFAGVSGICASGQLAHVAELHRRAGRVQSVQFIIGATCTLEQVRYFTMPNCKWTSRILLYTASAASRIVRSG